MDQDQPQELNAKQRRFAAEYAVCGVGKTAAIAAGYSEASAESQASRLLRHAKVRAEIDRVHREQEEDLNLHAARVLQPLLDIANADLKDAVDDSGAFLAVHKMPAHIRRAIASVEVVPIPAGEPRMTDDGKLVETPARLQVVKVKLWDKTKAVELLGKRLKLWTDKVELSGTMTLEQFVTGSMGPPKTPEGG